MNAHEGLLLNQLELGATGTIVVMICKMWDVNAATGQYLSTDFIVSYIEPNKDEFRVMRFVDFMVEFDGDTTIQKSSMKSKGFNCYPFQLVEIDDLEPTNNKFLVDVAGYGTNMGRSTQQRTGSKTLDFYLANRRNSLYLSSTSSTLIVDDEKIHVLTQLKTDDSGVELTKEILSGDNTAPKPGTLENLLMWALNQKYDSSTLYYEVKIDKVKTKKVKITPNKSLALCVQLSTCMYRLKLEIYDDTAEVVVVMFDETETSLVKCSAGSIVGSKDQPRYEAQTHTYYKLRNYESFACSKVVTNEVVEGSASSDMVAAKASSKAPVLKRLSKSLSVATPSQLSEEKNCVMLERSFKIPTQRNLLLQIVSQKEETWAVLLIEEHFVGLLHTVNQMAAFQLRQPGERQGQAKSGQLEKHANQQPYPQQGLKFPTIPLVLHPTNVAVAMQPCGLRKEITKGTGLQPATSRFRDQIRVYNGMFCFTSFGPMIDHLINVGRGLYTFRINGQNYHRNGSLLPKDDTQPRQYNVPTVAKVVALITNDFGDDEPTRDIVVKGFQSTRKTNRGYVTIKEYYAYVIQYIQEQGTTLLRGGRLFQQYLGDAYTAIEEQRLSWTRNNQDTLRVDLYHNACDAVTRGDTNAAGLGKRIVLPHTFTGGPRYMMQNYQDAMALCRAYGNPDLFITFTSNPKGGPK
ncbi:retrotransposon protein, putative, unclassified [Tanacetum coccineum]